MPIWLWVENRYPKWNPGRRKHGLKFVWSPGGLILTHSHIDLRLFHSSVAFARRFQPCRAIEPFRGSSRCPPCTLGSSQARGTLPRRIPCPKYQQPRHRRLVPQIKESLHKCQYFQSQTSSGPRIGELLMKWANIRLKHPKTAEARLKSS